MKAKKSVAIILSVLLVLLVASPIANAAQTENLDEVRWEMEEFLYEWNAATHWQQYTPNWRPEEYHYDGTNTEYNGTALVNYAYYMHWKNNSPYDIYSKEGMLAAINDCAVTEKIDVEKLPFYNEKKQCFIINDPMYGFIGDYQLDFDPENSYWNIKKNEKGNWVAKYDRPTMREEETFAMYYHITIEMTEDFKLVYFNIDDTALKSAEWKVKPSVTEYKIGEALNLDGAAFIAESDIPHRDGTVNAWEVKVTPDMVTGYSPEKTGKQTLTVNYYNKSLTFDVTVLPKEEAETVVLENKDTGAKLETEKNVIPEDTKLIVKPVTGGVNFKIINNALEQTSDKWVAYDISLESKGVEIQPNGTVKITMPRPSGLNMNKMALYHIAEDGTKTLIPFTLDENNKNIIFETDHFSLYVFAEKKDGADINVEIPDTENSGNSWALIVIGIMLLAGAGCVLPVIKKKKYN